MRLAVTFDLQLAPSILSADFARLAEEVATVESVSDWLHVDVMDGHYVDNLTLGPPIVARLRGATRLPFDTHLMITDPATYAPRFVDAGCESITFHPEVADDPRALIDALHERGVEVGVAVKPTHALDGVTELLDHVDLLLLMTVEPGWGGQAFLPEVVPKIAEAAAWRREHAAGFRLQVDGGITAKTVGQTVTAGADTLVAGSAIFGEVDRLAAASVILQAAAAARSSG